MTDVRRLAPRRCFTHDLLGTGRVLVQDATTMALDLAGFTSLTERLSMVGTRGTEELSSILGSYFGRVTDVVAEAGGDPVAFGGDSLSIVFDGAPGPTLDAARGAADRIQDLTAESAGLPTAVGPLGVRVRVGIAYGTVATAVARSASRLLAVHVGPGLDLAHAAQEAAVVGAVAVQHPEGLGRGRAACASQHGSVTGALAAPDGPAVPPVDARLLLSPVLLDRLERGRGFVESHRVVTVAFVRFPPVEPGAMPAFLARVAGLMDLMDAYGGEVVQVSGGDKGVLALVVWGAPTAHADDPVRGVHAMLELRRQQPGVAVGIATGPVFAAVMGSRTRMFPTHSGLAVNVAARLSQLAHPGRIIASNATWESARRHLRQAGRPRRHVVKGCAAPVVVHEVTGWRHAPPRLDSSALPLLVGRVPELGRVEELLDAVAAGRGGAVVLEGEPGVGKTRLAQEAAERASTRGFSVVWSDAGSHPRGHAQAFWRGIVGGLLSVRGNASRREWRDALEAALPDVPDPLSVLAQLLGLRGPPGGRLVTSSEEGLAAELAQAALGRLLSARARREPVLLVVESVERLDEASLGVLGGLLAGAVGDAAGVLVTRGDESEAAVGAFLAEVPTLTLSALDRHDTELVAAEAWRRAGGGAPPAWLAGAVVVRAGGNPLFAQVVARALLERWEPGAPPPVGTVVEGSVTGLLVSQIDRLPVQARELLTVLAVAQRACDLPLLEQILSPDFDASAIREALARLLSGGLVARAEREEAYRLGHDLLRQVVYDAASHAQRERLHRRFVACLSAADGNPIEIAEHVHPLQDPDLARRWFSQAAHAARDSWNITGALQWLERLEPLVRGRAREVVELELLEVLLIAGRANEVLERLGDPARNPSSLPGDEVLPGPAGRVLAARRWHVLAEATYSCGQLERTGVAASRVMDLVDGTDEPRYQRAGELLALARCHQGDVDGATRAGRALVERAARAADPVALASALAALGVALVLQGQPEAAAERYEAALDAAVEAGDVVRQVHVLSDLAGCAYLSGQHVRCVELLADARAAAERIGYRRHLAFNLNNEAQLRAARGDAYATSCAAVAVQRCLELGDVPTAADALHTWITAKVTFAADPALWRRLVQVDGYLNRSLEAAAEWGELAVALARSGQCAAARTAAEEAALAADTCAPGSDSSPIRVRAALALLLSDAHEGARPSRDVREQVLAGLTRLADSPDLDDRDAAELAVERWRLSRSSAHRQAAVSRAHRAFAVEPSAAVRSWFRALQEPVPAVPDPLPPPAGIAHVRTTRRDLEEALAQVEAAALATRHPHDERQAPPGGRPDEEGIG